MVVNSGFRFKQKQYYTDQHIANEHINCKQGKRFA